MHVCIVKEDIITVPMIYDQNMFDIQITKGASVGNTLGAVGSPVGRARPRATSTGRSHKYSYFTATTELNNNTVH